MDFGIMFFSSADQQSEDDKYRLLIEATKYADREGFSSVWTPERHFHPFGGLFPNPAVTSAAIAVITRDIRIMAGSLISPLHNPIRVVEEWSMVDNLSSGRIGVSFGSGWNSDDFVFFPERYHDRVEVMHRQIEVIKNLWSGGVISQPNGMGNQVSVKIFPKPVQERLPIWVTSSGNVETFIKAGEIGANILTHLLGQDLQALNSKIASYREARQRNNFDPSEGKVTLMLHTFLGPDVEFVKNKVSRPFREYLRSAVKLEEKSAEGGGAISGGHRVESHDIPTDAAEELLDIAFERYFHQAALMGTLASCARLVWELEQIGVDEIGCLIDFGVEPEDVLDGLTYLNTLRLNYSQPLIDQKVDEIVRSFSEVL
jgi:natural product biosynthesis luciferase-like monooxygenase protein